MAADLSAAHRHEVFFHTEIACPGANRFLAWVARDLDTGLLLTSKVSCSTGKSPNWRPADRASPTGAMQCFYSYWAWDGHFYVIYLCSGSPQSACVWMVA